MPNAGAHADGCHLVDVIYALWCGRPKTEYAIVPGRFVNFTVPRPLPDRWLDRLIARNVGLTNAGRAAAER
jgi:hypothetical protein